MALLQKYKLAVVLVLISAVYVLYQVFQLDRVGRVHGYDLVTQGVTVLISLAGVFIVQRIRSHERTYPFLMSGFSFLYASLLTTYLSELFHQPMWMVSIVGHGFEAVAYLLIVIGLLRWVSYDQKAREQIYEYATTDSLTGVFNRRHFEDVLTTEVERAKRYKTPLALVTLNLDHFKKVNDAYGHGVGDEVLRGVARLVKKMIRGADTLARVGGDEFQILAPATDLGDALGFADKLRTAIEDTHFERAGFITASFGVAELDPEEDSAGLLQRTEKALHGSKEGGRNRLVAAP